ncbi:MAG: type II toxin-antitoxin system RelE/ParE family toxin [Pseudomonadota bacterium]
MIGIRQTAEYQKWFDKLRDQQARARINIRIRRLSLGHFGDVKTVGQGVSELRIPYGPGYRLYFTRQYEELILLLYGGDKSSQERDIARAHAMMKDL